MGKVLQGPEQQVQVGHQQIDRADGHFPPQNQPAATANQEAGARAHDGQVQGPHEIAQAEGLFAPANLFADEVQHLADGVGHPAQRFDVLETGQTLLDEPEQLGGGLAQSFVVRHPKVPHGQHDPDGQCQEAKHPCEYPPVLGGHDTKDAEQNQGGADQPNAEDREEVGQLIAVAVDAFQHLAGRVAVEERHVQPDAVLEQVFAQPIGGGPRHRLAEVLHQGIGQVAHDVDDHVQRHCLQQDALTVPGHHTVDEVPQDARTPYCSHRAGQDG